MKIKNHYFLFLLIVSLCAPSLARAATAPPKTVAELALYRGADRQQILEEGARKEKNLTFYTTGILTQTVRPLVSAFQKKYPFIKVEIWRGSGRELTPRLFEEYQAGRFVVDAIEVNQIDEIVIEKHPLGILQPFYSPNLDFVEEDSLKKVKGGALWAGHYESNIGLGYNTKLISKAELPKTYQELTDQKWKGKGALVPSNTGVTWLGAIHKNFGEDLLKKIAAQNFTLHAVSAAALLDMIINGEYAFSPTIYNAHVNKSKQKGAPVDWLPLEPAPAQIGQIMLPARAPHPHAALLFIDFDLSKEAGELYKANGYVSPRKDVSGVTTFKKDYGAQSLDQVSQWNKVFDRIFLKK